MARSEVTEETNIEQWAEHIAKLERERDEATTAAEGEIAGMREVALFRAANAQGCLGNYARPLLTEVERLRAALEKIATEPAPGSTVHCRNEALVALGRREKV